MPSDLSGAVFRIIHLTGGWLLIAGIVGDLCHIQKPPRWVWRMLMTGMLMLLASGVYNWMQSAGLYREIGPIANILVGTKVLLALSLFGVIFARDVELIPRAKRRVYLVTLLVLFTSIVILATSLRTLTLAHLGG